MSLQPVEATLIAASVGAVASTCAVVITHLLTRARDRYHRIWDRRMDAYKHLLRSRRDFAFARTQFLTAKSRPAQLIDAAREMKEFNLIRAEVEMFGSTAVNAINFASVAVLGQWMQATTEWHELDGRAATDPEARRKADQKWDEIRELSEGADLIDQRLAEAIQVEAAFRVPFKLEWWRTPFRRNAIKR